MKNTWLFDKYLSQRESSDFGTLTLRRNSLLTFHSNLSESFYKGVWKFIHSLKKSLNNNNNNSNKILKNTTSFNEPQLPHSPYFKKTVAMGICCFEIKIKDHYSRLFFCLCVNLRTTLQLSIRM